MANRSPFQRRQAAYAAVRGAETAELRIYDEIGFWGVQARDVLRDLDAIDAAEIHVRLNSPGGDVFDGQAIYTALREHPARIVVHVDALAASIASLIAMAGDELRMARGSFLMVHHPWNITVGNAAEHRRTADLLDRIGEEVLVRAYMERSGASREQVVAWMDDETWFTPEEARAAGLADAEEHPAASLRSAFDLSIYQKVPAALRGRTAQGKRDAEGILREAGFSRTEAKRAIAALAGIEPTTRRDAGHEAVVQKMESLITLLTGSTR